MKMLAKARTKTLTIKCVRCGGTRKIQGEWCYYCGGTGEVIIEV